MRNISADYLNGARAIVPISLGIGVLGLFFGVVARSAGFSPPATVLLSATLFAGSAQFIVVSMVAAGAAPGWVIVAAAFSISRYAVIGLSLGQSLSRNKIARALIAQLAVDETLAVAYAGGGRFNVRRLLGAGAVLWCVHVSSTALGALVAGGLPEPRAIGVDVLSSALLIALLFPQLHGRTEIAAAGLGAIIALALVPVAPPGLPVLAGAAAALIGLRWL